MASQAGLASQSFISHSDGVNKRNGVPSYHGFDKAVLDALQRETLHVGGNAKQKTPQKEERGKKCADTPTTQPQHTLPSHLEKSR